MKINLTPIRRGEKIDIFADIFSDTAKGDISLTAKPISFRPTELYTQDQPNCIENGPLLTLSVESALEFADAIKLLEKK